MNFKELVEKYGEVFSSAKSLVDNPKMVISVSPQLDLALGGGVQEGSLFVLTGAPKVGKSISALSFASNCQKDEFGGREVFYCNTEGRLKKRDIEGIQGLKFDKFHIIGSSQGNVLTASKYLSIVEELIHTKPGSVIIIDSFSAMVSDAEFNGTMDDVQRADLPKIIAKFTRKISPILNVNNNILVGITHVMANPSGYGQQYVEKSGLAVGYLVDAKLKALTFKKILDKNGSPIQQEIEWKVETAGLEKQTLKVTSVITFGIGIDRLLEMCRLATDLNIIEKKGSWFSLNGSKVQGEEKLVEHVRKNDLYNELEQEIKAMFA